MKKNRLALGIFFILIAELSFTLMWSSVKFSGKAIPVFEIAFFRGIVSVFIVGFIILFKRLSFKVQNKKILFARSLSGFIAMILSFYTLTKIGIGNAVTLLHTSPIFVAVLSPLLLKEKARKSLLMWIIISFIGVILVVKPNENIFQNVSLLALLGGFLAAIAYMTIRHLHITENTLTITFYFTLFISLASFPFMISTFVTPTPIAWLALAGAGIFGTIGQLLLTYSYKCGPANIITPFNNSAIVFSFIFGWAIWQEVPDLMTIFGAIIIIVAIVFISLIANRRRVPKYLPRIGDNA